MKTKQVLSSFLIAILSIVTLTAMAQKDNRIVPGQIANGQKVSFLKTSDGLWDIDISGKSSPAISQSKPAIIEVYQSDEDIRELNEGYKLVRQVSKGIEAKAEIFYNDKVSFQITDQWSLDGNVIAVKRKVEVKGNATGGFNSSIVLSIDPSVAWADINCLVWVKNYVDPSGIRRSRSG
jgi:hypothetical protein